ncbi:exodeoxyribonuclease V subunit alpha [Celerinatantimonas sp. YJH-8]|uniref:exodeoxyribonuclease V subunit alpha n=1 Tax=Celerinatantimonas sp. YJH-8 TaxID=3228714 RepID=UPI0038BE8698
MIDVASLQQLLQERDKLRPLDWHFARFLSELGASESVKIAAALASRALSRGDSCLPIAVLQEQLASLGWELSLDAWAKVLRESAVIGEDKPLVFDGERLYLNRYWQFERQLASRLSCGPQLKPPAPSKVKPILNRLFGAVKAQTDWQRAAAALACQRQLLVISGGPGTGKTTTVARLLALLQELALKEQGACLQIALVAPTGKAAARLSESMVNACYSLTDSPEAVVESIPRQASTIHRLLGVIPGRHHFIHHAQNPLLVDLLVVDEASMIDLSLMTHLFAAISSSTRVILLGDRDQLASVEAGSVLADICEFIEAGPSGKVCDYLHRCGAADLEPALEPVPAVADNLVMLRHSYRFDERSGIGQLARAVNRGDSPRALQCFDDKSFSDIDWRDLSEASYRYVLEKTVSACQHYLTALQQGQPLKEVFQAFTQFQLLVALRQGDFGVEGLNARIQQQLYQRGALTAAKGWCVGLPVMVQSNDHAQQLYNGDIGIFVQDSHGTLMVAFESATADAGIRWLLPSRLPEHESVFAMTVHKSQGSEFNEVLLLLPHQGGGNPTRELLYTGITRAKTHFSLIADETSLRRACQNRTRRRSGLAARLRSLT